MKKQSEDDKMLKITKAILHILDSDSDSLLCGQVELDAQDYAIRTYLESVEKRIEKLDPKVGKLDPASDIVKVLSSSELNFIEQTSEIAQLFFQLTRAIEEAPSGDLLCFEAEKMEEKYFGFVKLNYKPQYTHYVDYVDDKMSNNIILNKAIFPGLTQKLDEFLLISYDDFSFELVEKKYVVDGEKIDYISEKMLQTIPTPTVTENISIMKKAIKKVADKYNEEKFVSMSNVQEAVYESIEAEGVISKELVADKVFEDNYSAKQEYLEIMEQTRFDEKAPVNVPKYEKKYRNQKLKLANGIEMSIPLDVYKNKELIEFINNPDGTISVMIKNVDEIVNKF